MDYYSITTMLHEDRNNKIRVGQPTFQLTEEGEYHYQFDTGSWIVFSTLGEASEFIRDQLRYDEGLIDAKKENGGA